MPNDYLYSGIKHFTPIQSFNLGLGTGMGSGRDMLNLTNGNNILEFTDFILPFYNSPLTLKRFYNNLCDVTGIFGEGWHSIWEMKMSEDGDDRVFVDQTGAEWTFIYNAGSYDRPAGLFAELTVDGNTYTITNLRDKSEIVFVKNGQTGNYYLSYIQNAVGVKHALDTEKGESNLLSVTTTHTGGGNYSRTLEFTYNDDDLVISVKETSEDREIEYEYDDNDRLIKVTLPNGDYCEFTYSATYKLTQFKDYNNNVTRYEYDGSNRLSKRIGACGQEHGFTYNANQTVVNDPLGKNWTHNFNANKCRTSLVTPRSKTYSWTYNGDFLVLTYVIPGPKTAVTNTYDADGFIQTTTDALSKQYGFTWNGSDLLTTITDPDSNTIVFTYNADRQVLTVTNQESEVTEYAYSSLGALETITDPKDFETDIENNVFGQAIKVTDPIGQTVETTYDAGSIVPISVVGKDGKTNSFVYDELKRILEKEFVNGDTLEYSWDGSRLLEIVKQEYNDDIAGEVLDFTKYSHDGVNRVVTVETKNGGNTRYEFDKNGRAQSVHGKDCQIREYTYDDDGNLTKVRIDGDSSKDYDFTVDDRGWRTKITYPNSWYVDYTRNDRGQLSRISVKTDQAAEKHRIDYTYDNLALVANIDEHDYDNSAAFMNMITRDDVGRITVEFRRLTSGSWGSDYIVGMTYDDNGNATRIYESVSGEDYNMDFDPLNRLVRYYEADGGEKGIFSYNCAGLLKAREVDGDITKFEYDAHGVLDQIIKPNADELDFNFDMLGRLRRYDTDSRESTFNYDGTKRLGDDDADAEEWKRYHWCKSQFLGYEDDTNTYYIVPDREGSTKVIISSGAVVNRIEYDQLGKIRSQTTTPQVELLWRGKYFISELEMYIFGISLSDPKIGLGPLEKQMTVFDNKHSLFLKKKQDEPLCDWWIPAVIIILENFLIADTLACESALRTNDKLWNEFNFTHSTGNYNSNPYNPFYGTGYSYTDYNDWLSDWDRRADSNHEQISAVCWGKNM